MADLGLASAHRLLATTARCRSNLFAASNRLLATASGLLATTSLDDVQVAHVLGLLATTSRLNNWLAARRSRLHLGTGSANRFWSAASLAGTTGLALSTALASTKILQAMEQVLDRGLLAAAACRLGAASAASGNGRTSTTIPSETAAAEGHAQQERSKYNLGIH
jgi:hypothetical protein